MPHEGRATGLNGMNISDGTITSGKITDGAVTTVKLQDSVVTGIKMADGSVTGAKIAAGAIAGSNIESNTIGSGHLATNSVKSAEIATGAVKSAEIADGAITATDLDASSIGLWEVNGANVYRSSGNVGIGTNSPQTQLHIKQTGASNISGLRLETSSTTSNENWHIFMNSSDDLLISNDGLNTFKITKNSGDIFAAGTLEVDGFRTEVPTSGPAFHVIGGYSGNSVAAGSKGGTISGGGDNGRENRILNDAIYGAIGGGWNNTVSGTLAVIGGGEANVASGTQATIAGGTGNSAIGTRSSIGGGITNSALGFGATIPGGESCEANGRYSFATGLRAHAEHDGAFVWADYQSQEPDFVSTSENQFLIRASGGVGIGTNSPNAHLEVVGTNAISPPADDSGVLSVGDSDSSHIAIDTDEIQRFSTNGTPGVLYLNYHGGDIEMGSSSNQITVKVNGTTVHSSDRNVKEDFQLVDSNAILERLSELPLSTWKYKGIGNRRHVGPVAQDFHAAFDTLLNLQSDDTTIAPLDEAGVAFAAIQGLNKKVEEQQGKISAKDARISDLESRLAELEAMMAKMAEDMPPAPK